jgi:hypothetical protein
MNTFGPRIWGCDLGSVRARVARAAGWHWCNILWQDLSETANIAVEAQEFTNAKRLFRRADWIARLCFEPSDLRRVTSKVNRALMADGKGRVQIADMAAIWARNIPQVIENMEIHPRARSSLFDLRMEARHRSTFHDNFRKRLTNISLEVGECLQAMARNQPVPHRLYSRWKGEKPTVYDDTRKVLSACLLIAEVG